MDKYSTSSPSDRPVILEADGGNHFHFLGHLASIKVAAGNEGQLSVVEFRAPKGFGPPLHRHNEEDELFVILDGELNLKTDGVEQVGRTGSVALLPRGVPHQFQVLSQTARFINVTGAGQGTPRFDKMVSTLGIATAEPLMPGEMEIDPEEVARVCGEYGIDILGPPPPPLD